MLLVITQDCGDSVDVQEPELELHLGPCTRDTNVITKKRGRGLPRLFKQHLERNVPVVRHYSFFRLNPCALFLSRWFDSHMARWDALYCRNLAAYKPVPRIIL